MTAKTKWTAATVADVLGINRTRDNDLRPMVRALGLMTWRNTDDDWRRKSAAEWALRNWSKFTAECSARRNVIFARRFGKEKV